MLPVALADAADAVLMGEMVGHRLDRDQIGLLAELAAASIICARQPGVFSTSSSGSITANGSSPTMSRAHQTAWPSPSGACCRVKLMAPASRLVARQNVLLGLLAARRERGVELEHAVEMILDHALVAAGDEDEMLDAGFLGLVDHVLDQRLVDDGQHFLRHRLGGGQDAGAETGDREDGFADFHGNVDGP